MKRPFVFLFTLTVAAWLATTIARANVGTVTAGTITGTTINGNTITGGTITGAYISGGTVEGGGGIVTINSGGIQISGGTSNPNKIRWSNGAYVGGNTTFLDLVAPGTVVITAPDMQTNADFYMNNGTLRMTASSPLLLDDPNFQGSTQTLCVNSSGVVFASAGPC